MKQLDPDPRQAQRDLALLVQVSMRALYADRRLKGTVIGSKVTAGTIGQDIERDLPFLSCMLTVQAEWRWEV
jgi:hypothetical protein